MQAQIGLQRPFKGPGTEPAATDASGISSIGTCQTECTASQLTFTPRPPAPRPSPWVCCYQVPVPCWAPANKSIFCLVSGKQRGTQTSKKTKKAKRGANSGKARYWKLAPFPRGTPPQIFPGFHRMWPIKYGHILGKREGGPPTPSPPCFFVFPPLF